MSTQQEGQVRYQVSNLSGVLYDGYNRAEAFARYNFPMMDGRQVYRWEGSRRQVWLQDHWRDDPEESEGRCWPRPPDAF